MQVFAMQLMAALALLGQLEVVTLVAGLAGALVGALHLYNKHCLSYWARRGVPSLDPLPLFGNSLEVVLAPPGEAQLKWGAKIGTGIGGLYLGLKPELFIVDPEVVRQICIKDADKFTDHDFSIELGNKYHKNFLFFLKGAHWQRVRALMSPTFTSGKIKRMFAVMDECADDLVRLCELSRQRGLPEKGLEGAINLRDLYSLYTIDTIARCCFALKLDRCGASDFTQVSKRNDMIKSAMEIFKIPLFRYSIGVILSERMLSWLKFEITPEWMFKPLVRKLEFLVSERRSRTTQQRVDDLLQLLIDARLSEELQMNDMDEQENHHAGLDKQGLENGQASMVKQVKAQLDKESQQGKPSKLALTDLEIVSNASFMMAVGLETTASALTAVTYCLAHHPEVQQKLYETVASFAKPHSTPEGKSTKGRFSYEDLTSCHYLDSCLSEALRMCTPLVGIDRRANEDYYLEKYRLHIPKGHTVLVGIHALHHSPDFWDEPEKYDPMRFMPENRHKIVPGSYLPFGTGPRYCIGMRFSLTESKLALARLILNFKFEPAPGFGFPMAMEKSVALIKFKTPYVKVVSRH